MAGGKCSECRRSQHSSTAAIVLSALLLLLIWSAPAPPPAAPPASCRAASASSPFCFLCSELSSPLPSLHPSPHPSTPLPLHCSIPCISPSLHSARSGSFCRKHAVPALTRSASLAGTAHHGPRSPASTSPTFCAKLSARSPARSCP
eukprot:1513618-Rhodomonas_salina.2